MNREITHRDRATDLGTVRINNNAIASIASTAALEVRGVHKIGGGLRRTLYDIFKKPEAKGVRIALSESEVKLAITIVVDYGVDITRIADEVQENVKRAVEKMAGLTLAAVDVTVEGVYAPGLDKKKREGAI